MDAFALAREIAEMGRFMDREALAGRSVALIAAKQSAQFEAKLARIAHLTAQQANDLSDAFMRVSFTVDQKSTFASKIADTLGGDIRTVATTETQKIDIVNYMPPQLWEILDDTSVDIGVKSLHVANLFAALEVTTASEPSIARAAVVLATIGLANVVPSVDTLHNLHIHLKAGVKAASAGRAPAFAPLLVYPVSPADLPLERLVHAFGTVRPAGCPLDVKNHLTRLMKIRFQRASATGVNTPIRGGCAGHVVTSPTAATSPQLEQVLATMSTTIQALAQVMHRGGSAFGVVADNGGASSRMLSGFVPRASRPLQLPWAPDHALAAAADNEAALPPAEEPLIPRALFYEPMTPVVPEDPQNAVDVMRAAMHEAATGRGRGAGAKRSRGAKKQGLVAAARNVALHEGADEELRDEEEEDEAESAGEAPMKRPASMRKKEGRKNHMLRPSPPPPVMNGTEANPPETVFYNGGKIRMSFSKKSYRCFAALSCKNPIDKSFYWSDGGKDAAWSKALDHIDNTRLLE